ncbi:coiled-coil domain-containing protein 137 [Hyperolius riggenbachi]|uniref:coiled-coil domain-containing protein 137 n=1 Tax=Hyperolius riggenbachi TaxID=752182 RepID=UPI0035A2D8E5
MAKMGKKKKMGAETARPLGRPGMGAGNPHGKVKMKKKINSKPKDLDMQEIPFKLREIMKSRQEMDKPREKKKKKPPPPVQKQGPQNEELQTDIPVPKFKRGKFESEYAFLTRMNRETQHVIFLSKNQPDRLPEMELDEKGEMPKKDEVVKKQKSEKKKEFDRRRLNKFLKKKEDKKESRLEEEIFTDPVTFGEVAMAPPSLTAKPRKSVPEKKPGEKQLFLKKLLEGSGSPSHPPVVSLARKRIVEEERERVIEAYRNLKKRKLQETKEAKNRKRHKT